MIHPIFITFLIPLLFVAPANMTRNDPKNKQKTQNSYLSTSSPKGGYPPLPIFVVDRFSLEARFVYKYLPPPPHSMQCIQLPSCNERIVPHLGILGDLGFVSGGSGGGYGKVVTQRGGDMEDDGTNPKVPRYMACHDQHYYCCLGY